MQHFDVIVVGGGPAGTVSALKCSQLGLKVLLIEQGARGRHKPCGGILTPTCVDAIEDTLDTSIPRNIMCSPETLGLYYVPPSGRKNGGSMKNYGLLNIKRDLFDNWLMRLAEDSGVQVWNGAKFLEFQRSESIEISVRKKGRALKMKTRYLIGADGVYSRVRNCLYPSTRVKTMKVLQELCQAEGNFDDYFYTIFRGELSPTYSYVIPKDNIYLIGTGFHETRSMPLSRYISRFRKWLQKEFAFKLRSLEKRELWAIPYGFLLNGDGNVILVGDAAGFCNALSGEGIRLAIESGIAAGEAVKEAISDDKNLSLAYAYHVAWINDLVRIMYEFATSLTDDESREDFVRSELTRIPF